MRIDARTCRIIAAAITSAKAQLVQARREDAIEQKREQARAALPLAAKLRQNGQRAAEAIANLSAALARMKSDMAEAGRLGVRAPNFLMFRANVALALDTALTPAGLQRSLVAPSQRRDLAELIGAYADAIEADIRTICGEHDGASEAA